MSRRNPTTDRAQERMYALENRIERIKADIIGHEQTIATLRAGLDALMDHRDTLR